MSKKYKLIACLILSVIIMHRLLILKNMFIVTSELIGFDFNMRYCEALCISEGIDPFLIWTGQIDDSRFIAWSSSLSNFYSSESMVHAYPPWSYAALLPLTIFSKENAALIFHWLCLISMIYIFSAGYISARKTHPPWSGLLCLLCMVYTAAPAENCLIWKNYGILISMACLSMILCLNEKLDILAGVFWALMMIKPQIGLLFAIPILIHRRWKTLLCAVALCLFGTLISSMLCGSSPVEMVLCVTKYGSANLTYTGLIHKSLYAKLESFFGQNMLLIFNIVLGIILCLTFSVWIRLQKNWFILLLPPVLLCTVWAKTWFHDQCIHFVAYIPLICCALALSKIKDKCLFFATIFSLAIWDGIGSLNGVPLYNYQPFPELITILLLGIICYKFRPKTHHNFVEIATRFC